MHVSLSVSSILPIGHEQKNEPGVFMQLFEHPLVLEVHSSISKNNFFLIFEYS